MVIERRRRAAKRPIFAKSSINLCRQMKKNSTLLISSKQKGCKKANLRKIFNQFMSADEEKLDFINFVEAARAVNCELDAEDDDDDEDVDDDVVG